MYTTHPLPDCSDAHVGFYVLLAIAVIFLGIVLFNILKDLEFDLFGVGTVLKSGISFGLCAWLLIYAGIDSWTPNHPQNIEVQATLVGFLAVKEQHGKTTVDQLYVGYTLPDGKIVEVKGDEGVPYADTVTLYKN